MNFKKTVHHITNPYRYYNFTHEQIQDLKVLRVKIGTSATKDIYKYLWLKLEKLNS